MKRFLHHHRNSIAGVAVHVAVLTVLVAAIAWGVTYGISLASPADPATPVSPLTSVTPPAATAQVVGPERPPIPAAWLGLSGSLRAMVDTPAALRTDASFTLLDPDAQAVDPGVHKTGLSTPDGDSFYVVTMHPYDPERGAMIGTYHVGSWPAPTGNPIYNRPRGVIEVTPDNESTPLSEHFQMRDFLTHDQGAVWPKALVIQPKLVDKLELISQELARRGLPSKLHVMSGFRTPQYNALEVHPGGRAKLSRHMYGDASDVFVDADGNGQMDDLNGDGKVTIADAQVLFRVAESVEAGHPELIGGLSAYPATVAHGPFVHVDTRGKRARW